MTSFMQTFDPSLDLFNVKKEAQLLDSLFYPQSVAVIGASAKSGSVGWSLLWNLTKAQFNGKIFPVNPKYESILDLKCYPSILDIKEKVDLVVIATPAMKTPSVIEECTKCGVKIGVIISGGFKELGKEGALLEEKVLEKARLGNMRLIGPNCLGIMNPYTGLNATFAAEIALKGNIAFISQSGALGTAALDWSLKEKVGLSAFVSIGSMSDLNWGDLIHYFGHDPNTKSIFIYMESIGNPRSFLSAARKVSLTKPIILIKGGLTEESAKAATSHTGALASSNAVLSAALRRSGIIRVPTINDLFNTAHLFSKQPRPKGVNLAIITNAGGPAVIATDALIANGGKLGKLSEESLLKLNDILPSFWSHSNPIDILGDATAERYAKAVEIVEKDPNFDGILVILTPQHMTFPNTTADALKRFATIKNKTLLASWMGGEIVERGRKILDDNSIPNFDYPDDACRAFAYMHFEENKDLYETSYVDCDSAFISKRKERAAAIIESIQQEGRTLLSEFESKQLLHVYGIPTIPTHLAKSVEEAASLADQLGYPVVLKLHSKSITHKSDIGGVKLNLKNREDIKNAFNEIKRAVIENSGEKSFDGVSVQLMNQSKGYELILGSSSDPEFGPVLLFGTGGTLVEIFKDRALALPPLTPNLATRLMQRTKIYNALKGVRGEKSVDIASLEQLLVNFSHLVSEQKWIKEIDINPLFASPDGLFALDARIVLYQKEEEIKKLAIIPYPCNYVVKEVIKDQKLSIRPVKPDDLREVEKFYKDLAHNPCIQHYLRLFNMESLPFAQLVDLCFNDYENELAFAVETPSKEIIGMSKLTRSWGTKNGSFALLIKREWGHRGVGSALLSLMVKVAKDNGIETLTTKILKDNKAMEGLCKKLGFQIKEEKEYLIAKRVL